MMRPLLPLGLVVLLAACGDGQPFEFGEDGGGGGGGGDGPDTTETTVPEAIAGSLVAARFVEPNADNPDGRLRVRIQSLDSTQGAVDYERTPSLDVAGYTAYSVQEDPLDRFYTGLARESADGSIQGAVVADGGQFGRYFGGATYQRTEPYSPYEPTQPNRGLVSYAGTYAGLLNGGPANPDELLPVPPGTDPSLLPNQSTRTRGDVFLNADFTDNAVNGAITNRRLVDTGARFGDINLIASAISDNGEFAGTVETVPEAADEQPTAIGDYAGAFGGTGATAVAGGVYIRDFLDDVENEEERGLFVLQRCGTRGDAAICDDVDPRGN